MRLDPLSQITYEYWKDEAADHVGKRLRTINTDKALDKAFIETLLVEVKHIVMDGVFLEVRNVRSSTDESYIRNIMSSVSQSIDYESIASKILFDYVPERLGITVRKQYTPVAKKAPLIKRGKR